MTHRFLQSEYLGRPRSGIEAGNYNCLVPSPRLGYTGMMRTRGPGPSVGLLTVQDVLGLRFLTYMIAVRDSANGAHLFPVHCIQKFTEV